MENLTYRQASRFLDMATCGIKKGEIESLMQSDRQAWVDDQLNLPMSSHVEQLQQQMSERGASEPTQDMRVGAWFDLALWGEDQLRQRMAFALSQFLVVSDKDMVVGAYPLETTEYYDMLTRHAFGNFRDLLYDVTRSPIMGNYLTMVNNKAEAVSGTLPDENYARELLQLFSIGLYELNLNGEPILDNNGIAVETYDDHDIANLARLFTGWELNGDSMSAPMITNDSNHDSDGKTILGHFFPAGAGAGAEAELQQLLDILMNHQSTAPFVSKFLITRFVTSNPKPDYVERVATVFKNTNGDLEKVITAVLTDSEVLESNSVNVAKMREPILAMTFFYRSMDAVPGNNKSITYNPMKYKETFNQYPLGSNSVFNFYSPTHSPQGSLQEQGLFAPELEIINWKQLTSIGNVFYDTMKNYAYDDSKNNAQQLYLQNQDFVDVAEAQDVEPLLTMIADRFLHGQLSDELRPRLIAIYDTHASTGKKWTVRKMLFLTLLSSDFQVQE